MPKTIKIRYKDSSSNWPGDVSSHNSHNLPGGFDGPKYPGYEEDIPGDFLDDEMPTREYKNRDQSIEMITEMEYRRRLYETGGYHRRPGQKFHEPAPPQLMQNKTMLKMYAPPRKLAGQELLDFMWKTKVATLLFKEFSPLCMELIGPMPKDAMELLKKKAKETGSKTYSSLISGPAEIVKEDPDDAKTGPVEKDVPDITKMDDINAVKYVKEVTNVKTLKDYSALEAKKSRPRVAVAIEERIKELTKSQEI